MLETPLTTRHREAGARMIEFHGWALPLLFSSIIEEHRAVRGHAGLFDVSHMPRFRVTGKDSVALLARLLTCDVKALTPSRAKYALMCGDDGGILEDAIVFALRESFVIVGNASNRTRDHTRLTAHGRGLDVKIEDTTEQTGMIALQGPGTAALTRELLGNVPARLDRFGAAETEFAGSTILASRTGYTGEDGFEFIAPKDAIVKLWDAFAAGGAPQGLLRAGLGARDTLRLEAALALYGNEIDPSVNPFEARLAWTVDFRNDAFAGREALRRLAREGIRRKLAGVELGSRRIARHGFAVRHDGRVVGSVTSGTFSPTLERSIALVRVERSCAEIGGKLLVEIRGHEENADVVGLPFVRR
ncbi:MAG: glycine cleavage system aminomethyltransferase GcvT [Planctomycetota bacterium]